MANHCWPQVTQRRIQDFSQGRAPNDGLVLECYWLVYLEWWNSVPGVGARPSAHPLDPRLGHSQSMSQSVSPPYVELKKLWNTSLVPIQWTKSHDATKMPQLLCVKLEDPNIFTSQALRRSRAVIHLNVPTPLLRSGRSDAPGPGPDPGSTGSFDRMSTQDPGSIRCRSSPQWRSQGASGPRPPKANHRGPTYHLAA